jgi:hypothetical protein
MVPVQAIALVPSEAIALMRGRGWFIVASECVLGWCDEWMLVAGWAGRRGVAGADVTADREFGN